MLPLSGFHPYSVILLENYSKLFLHLSANLNNKAETHKTCIHHSKHNTSFHKQKGNALVKLVLKDEGGVTVQHFFLIVITLWLQHEQTRFSTSASQIKDKRSHSEQLQLTRETQDRMYLSKSTE
ncbi:hypothetical protein ILYODFUR_013250 [Ilyodon furcidens]|uniref:Uncharacterized protein n=1 Tax=Ilyodon furcidens TaxID=33524 RepID=A0ABV0UHV8_9TELE